MSDACPVFGVETIELDLPPLVGAISRRLHEAGVPVTPARSIEFTRALTLVRPITRRRLYWTARSVFVSDPAHVNAFDAVFFSIFGNQATGERLHARRGPYLRHTSDRQSALGTAGGRGADERQGLGGAR